MHDISIDITVGTFSTPPPYDPSITFASTVSWGASGIYVENKNIEVIGILVMDIPLAFINCNFSMTSGAIIQTSEDGDFVAIASKFFCCNDMWQGIQAKGGGSVSLWYSELEDARIAIQVDEDAPGIYLGGNRFNRNHIGITNGSAEPGDGTLNFGFFFDNRFECTSETYEAYDGVYFTPTNWSVAHILLDHCAASLVNIFSTSPNYFLDADHGIYLVDADVVAQNAIFQDLVIDGIRSHWESGSSAYAGSHIKVRDCTFSNAGFRAIWAVRSDLDVSSSVFNGYYFYGAIESTLNTSSEMVKINGSEFNYPATDFVEIWVERPVAVGNKKHLEINDNTFTEDDVTDPEYPPVTLGGIYAFGMHNIHIKDKAEISGNSFELHLPDTEDNPGGIVEAVIQVDMPYQYDNTTVNGNTITVDDARVNSAIIFDNQHGAGNEVSHNTVSAELGQNQLGDWYNQVGIDLLNNTSGLKLCDNTVSGTRDGIRFLANNGLCEFQSNTFGEHNTGLVIQNSENGGAQITGMIGDQIGHGNMWSTTPGAYLDKAGYIEQSALFSEFIIENAYSPGSTYFPATNLLSPSSGWFSNQSVSSDWCVPAPPSEPHLPDWDIVVADGSGDFSGLNTISKWEQRRLLLDKLLRYPDLIAENQTVSDFYDNWISSSPGRFAHMANNIREALAIDSTDQAEMDTLKAEREGLYIDLIELEGSVDLPEDVFDVDLDWVADKEALLAQIAENQASEATLKAQIRASQVDAAEDMLTANALLPDTTPYEANRKLLNRLTLQLFLNDSLTDTEEGLLRELAGSEDTSAGLAVRDALALLPLCEGRPASPRGQAEQQKQPNLVNGIAPASLHIEPNPATDRLRIQFSSMTPGRVLVTDATGKLQAIWDKPVQQNQLMVDVSTLPAGVYFMSYHPVSGRTSTQKLIILR